MNIVSLSANSREVLVAGMEEAKKRGNSHLGTEHLLLGLLANKRIFPCRLLRGDVSYKKAGAIVDRIFKVESDSTTNPAFTPRLKKVLEIAESKSEELGSPEIKPVHLALGLISCAEKDDGGVAARTLAELEVDTKELEAKLLEQIT